MSYIYEKYFGITLLVFFCTLNSCKPTVQTEKKLIINNGVDSVFCDFVNGNEHGEYLHFKNGILITKGHYLSSDNVETSFTLPESCLGIKSIPSGLWKYYYEGSGLKKAEGSYSTDCKCEESFSEKEDGWNDVYTDIKCSKLDGWVYYDSLGNVIER